MHDTATVAATVSTAKGRRAAWSKSPSNIVSRKSEPILYSCIFPTEESLAVCIQSECHAYFKEGDRDFIVGLTCSSYVQLSYRQLAAERSVHVESSPRTRCYHDSTPSSPGRAAGQDGKLCCDSVGSAGDEGGERARLAYAIDREREMKKSSFELSTE